MNKKQIYVGIVMVFLIFTGCQKKEQNKQNDLQQNTQMPTEKETGNTALPTEKETGNTTLPTEKEIGNTALPEEIETANQEELIHKDGTTLQDRIQTPEGYDRVDSKEDSLLSYLRKLELKSDGSPVLLYDGNEKGNQDAQIAVVSMDIGTNDLQQCADSIMRIYSEYLWSIGKSEKIGFHLTNGFYMAYTKWKNGYRIKVDGNEVKWVLSAQYDDSYECFRSYLTQVFMYAGTLSLYEESEEISLEEIQAGDMFIKGGSPGHCVMIVDIAENENGERCFLLAQGYMPAQDFHILKNVEREGNPWYFVSEVSYPFKTPQYTFAEGSLRHWKLWE